MSASAKWMPKKGEEVVVHAGENVSKGVLVDHNEDYSMVWLRFEAAMDVYDSLVLRPISITRQRPRIAGMDVTDRH